MIDTKKTVIDAISEYVIQITSDRNSIDEIKQQLRDNGISGGRIESVLNNPSILEDADNKEKALLVEQFFLKTGIQDLNPSNWYTEIEMKRARQFDRRLLFESEEISDIVLEGVSVVGNGVYVGTIGVEMISRLMNKQILNYNHDIQRQAKIKKRNDEIIMQPTVYRKNVKEIKDLLLKGELVSTTLAFNAAVGSSDSDDELIYDATRHSLTISKGTQLDVLDGFHRCLASTEAFQESPELDFKFMLMISNYTTKEAQQYQAQLAKATPIPKTRVQELEANRRADTVVRQLKAESELRGKISSHHQVSHAQGELVSYSVISDAIDREFELSGGKEVRDVSKFLIDFFDYLLIEFEEEFSYNSKEKRSLMSYNKMFSGYVALAANFKNNKADLNKIKTTLSNVDFSRDNKLWKELGLLNAENNISTRSSDRKIANYFRRLEIK